MSKGKEYGDKILKRIADIVKAKRKVLSDDDNYFVEKYLKQNSGYRLAAIEDLINSEDFSYFIFEEFSEEITNLIREIFLADNYGINYAGFVPLADTPEEYAEKERQQVISFYKDLNDAIDLKKRVNSITTDFKGFMAEVMK